MTGPNAEATRGFLEQRFARKAGDYQPHQPVFGIESGEPGQFLRLARTLRLISWIEALLPKSVLDLGAAEGYIANLVRLRVGCPVLCCDLSAEACTRAAELYGLPGLAGDASRLPLKPGCADVVILSEVFEHLPDPPAGLSAALTFAQRYVVFSTQELCASEFERRLRLALAEADAPHAELNFVTRADFSEMFGNNVAMAPQFRRTRRRLLEDVSRAQWHEHVQWLAQPRGWRSSEGLIAVVSVAGLPIPPMPQDFDPALVDMLLSGPDCAETQAVLPWDWLDPAAARPTGLTCFSMSEVEHPLHPGLRDKAHVFRRLHLDDTLNTSARRRRAARLLPCLERVGFLTCDDPPAIKLRWLRRQPLAGVS